MSHELFMDLSEEQQELVSGGGQLEYVDEFDYTNFEEQLVDFQKDISSNRNGSSIRKRLSTDFAYTQAYEDLQLEFDAPTAVFGGNDDNG